MACLIPPKTRVWKVPVRRVRFMCLLLAVESMRMTPGSKLASCSSLALSLSRESSRRKANVVLVHLTVIAYLRLRCVACGKGVGSRTLVFAQLRAAQQLIDGYPNV